MILFIIFLIVFAAAYWGVLCAAGDVYYFHPSIHKDKPKPAPFWRGTLPAARKIGDTVTRCTCNRCYRP